MKQITIILLVGVFLMSCENPIQMETKVYENGALDKTITFEKVDSLRLTQNIFGIGEATGWVVVTDTINSDEKDVKFKIEFKKSFSSAEEVNSELDTKADTLFHVHSSFEKSFRWFYTYIRYSETFRPIDRLKMLRADDYFNIEDRTFINRLPGEGTAISKADSFYLDQLNEKIFKHYANWGIYSEQMNILKEVLQKNAIDKKWYDSLEAHKDMIYESLDDMRGDPFFANKMADSLQIPLPSTAKNDFEVLSKDINSRVSFMSFARDGRYTNIIDMPWEVVNTNADSIAGNKLYWKPLATKFAIQEYEMFAESRKLNWWAIIVSVVILSLTTISFIKRRSYQS
jgi:hypothetical protein